MLDMKDILQRLQIGANAITSQILTDLITDNITYRAELVRKYEAYKASGLPISTRAEAKTGKANNKLVNDYRGEIVDQLVGYLFGNPVTYSLNNDAYPDKEDPDYKKHLTALKEFRQMNKLAELDGETGKFMSACGRAARLLYIDTKGKPRVMDVPPWECIFIYDRSLDEVQYALRYYNVYDMVDGKPITKVRIEWYDRQNVSYWISQSDGKGYIPDITEITIAGAVFMDNKQSHQFDMVPLVDIKNNAELQGDFEKTESLIDGYDRVLSDAQNEIEDLRAAYLLFKGVTPDEKVITEAKRTGAFGCEVGDSIEYLTKQLNDTYTENQKKSLRENIYRFSKTVDVNADTFTGSGASGEARRWLLLALENRGSKTALKFTSGVMTMFRIVAGIWKKTGIDLDPNAIEVALDRNLPVELLSEANIQSTLKGVVSDRTRLKLFSPIRDVDEEMRQIAKENEGMVNLDNVPGDGTGDTPAEAAAKAADAKTLTPEEYMAKYGEMPA
jgi:SPP1 family phage portal protein